MSRVTRALNALFPQDEMLTVYHCCLRKEAEVILKEGFAPPRNEAIQFWVRPEAFGQNREDRVSFGFQGLPMLQWVAMKGIHAAVTDQEPDLVALEVQVPRLQSRTFWSTACIGGIVLPGIAPELTCPRALVEIKGQVPVLDLLALPPQLPGVEAVKETIKDFRAVWKHRKEIQLAMAIPQIILSQAIWADAEGRGKTFAGYPARWQARRAERKFQGIPQPYEGLNEAWAFVREIFEAQGDREKVREAVLRFNARAEAQEVVR